MGSNQCCSKKERNKLGFKQKKGHTIFSKQNENGPGTDRQGLDKWTSGRVDEWTSGQGEIIKIIQEQHDKEQTINKGKRRRKEEKREEKRRENRKYIPER